MTYILNNKAATPGRERDIKMIDEAVRLGDAEQMKRIHGRWYRVVQTEPFKVYDFGARHNVRIKVKDGEYPYRAPRDGDWYVLFTDGSWRLMTDEAYTRYLYLLEDEINRLTKINH